MARGPPVRRTPHALGSMLFIGSLSSPVARRGSGRRVDEAIRSSASHPLACASHVALVGGAGLYLVSQAPRRGAGTARVDSHRRAFGGVRALAPSAIRDGSDGLGPPLRRARGRAPRLHLRGVVPPTSWNPPRRGELSPRWSALLYAPYLYRGRCARVDPHRRGARGSRGRPWAFSASRPSCWRGSSSCSKSCANRSACSRRRVRERTKDLESMQAAVIRTERMNLAATLGAGFAHDLNNALTVVVATAGALDRIVSPPVPRPRRSPTSRPPHGQAASLTNRLMHYARQPRGEPRPRLDLREAATEIEGLATGVRGARHRP